MTALAETVRKNGRNASLFNAQADWQALVQAERVIGLERAHSLTVASRDAAQSLLDKV